MQQVFSRTPSTSEAQQSTATNAQVQVSQETLDILNSIFSEVWHHFYDWEGHYSQSLIDSLASDSSDNGPSYVCRPSSAPWQALQGRIESLASGDDQVPLEISTFNNGHRQAYSRLTVDTVLSDIHIEPTPLYESCTPLGRSIFRGDDDDCVSFIPYADDVGFDHLSFTKFYSSFSWQMSNHDPDLELLVWEAALRARHHYGWSFSTIDKTGVLPLQLNSHAGRPGLHNRIIQRDVIDWPPTFKNSRLSLSSSSLPSTRDIRSSLENHVKLFCPNVSCMQLYCSVHVEPSRIPKPASPALTSDELRLTVSEPCGTDCFIWPSSLQNGALIPSEDYHDFRTVLDVCPDLSPCDLAVICRKVCREVFLWRSQVFPDHNILVARSRKPPRAANRALLFNDVNPEQFTPSEPCHHDGPCNELTQCLCYSNSTHCERNCHCSTECNRRWKGCKCAKANDASTCFSNRCPCFSAGRECDPELCVKCESSSKRRCFSSQIRQGRKKGLEVKKSKWGLGAFLTEPALQNELISEYCGELIYESTCDSRELVTNHRGRNYLFGLNETLSVDSSYAGNESRFINHVPLEKANARPWVRLVNGEHRIGIYAERNLTAGTEVVINYGPSFYLDDKT